MRRRTVWRRAHDLRGAGGRTLRPQREHAGRRHGRAQPFQVTVTRDVERADRWWRGTNRRHQPRGRPLRRRGGGRASMLVADARLELLRRLRWRRSIRDRPGQTLHATHHQRAARDLSERRGRAGTARGRRRRRRRRGPGERLHAHGRRRDREAAGELLHVERSRGDLSARRRHGRRGGAGVRIGGRGDGLGEPGLGSTSRRTFIRLGDARDGVPLRRRERGRAWRRRRDDGR